MVLKFRIISKWQEYWEFPDNGKHTFYLIPTVSLSMYHFTSYTASFLTGAVPFKFYLHKLECAWCNRCNSDEVGNLTSELTQTQFFKNRDSKRSGFFLPFKIAIAGASMELQKKGGGGIMPVFTIPFWYWVYFALKINYYLLFQKIYMFSEVHCHIFHVLCVFNSL